MQVAVLDKGMEMNVAKLLGIREKPAGMSPGTAIHSAIRKGLSVSVSDHMRKILKMSEADFANLIGVSVSTLKRKRQKHERLTSLASDRLYWLAKILSLATFVFGREERAGEWIMTPQFALNNQKPFEMIQTAAGALQVEALLYRIEHGVLL